ncbi:DUF11 domain-containing protein [Candidatus Daviesbacteria bacterium]|nr:DUF11 domain-containing protein [Candidatus Daviesbacteria bacterium]
MKHLVLGLALVYLFIFPVFTFAQYAQYGAAAAPAKQMLIEKKILNPQNNEFVDNLNLEQQTFLPNQEVTFRITVTNVIQSELKNLTVTDKLPDILNFKSSSFGNFDEKTKTTSFTIDRLKVGGSISIEVKTKVKSAEEIATNVVCQANLAKVTTGNMIDEDTASFCVSKQVLGVSEALPVTGPTQTLPLLILSFLFLATGLLIKRIIFLEGR